MRQFEVIEAEAIEDRGVVVIDVGLVLHRIPTDLIGLAVDLSALDAAAGHQCGVGKGMMIPPGVGAAPAAILAQRRPAEFASPKHHGVIQHAALFEILDQHRNRLIDGRRVEGDFLVEAAVLIPGGMNDVHETHAAFDQSTREHAIPREGVHGVLLRQGTPPISLGVLAADAILLEQLRVFIREIDQLRRGQLHARRQFVAGNAAGNLRVAHFLVTGFIQIAQGLQPLPLQMLRNALRSLEIQDRLPRLAEQHAGVGGRQETALVQGRSAAGTPPRGEHNVSREIPRFAAEPVGDPRAHRRHAKARDPALHHQLTGMMIELLAVHASHHQQIVRHRAQMRQDIAELHPALPVLLELPIAAHQHRRVGLNERETRLVQNRLRQALPVHLLQLWLRIEEIQLRRRARHEDRDAGIGVRLEMRRPRRHRIRRSGLGRPHQTVVRQGRAQGHRADAAGRRVQELTPGLEQGLFVGIHGVTPG